MTPAPPQASTSAGDAPVLMRQHGTVPSVTIGPIPDLLAEVRAGRYPYDFIAKLEGNPRTPTSDARVAIPSRRQAWSRSHAYESSDSRRRDVLNTLHTDFDGRRLQAADIRQSLDKGARQ